MSAVLTAKQDRDMPNRAICFSTNCRTAPLTTQMQLLTQHLEKAVAFRVPEEAGQHQCDQTADCPLHPEQGKQCSVRSKSVSLVVVDNHSKIEASNAMPKPPIFAVT